MLIVCFIYPLIKLSTLSKLPKLAVGIEVETPQLRGHMLLHEELKRIARPELGLL